MSVSYLNYISFGPTARKWYFMRFKHIVFVFLNVLSYDVLLTILP
jgi:hypothetical protein